jgi:hypothetical protein
MKKTVLFAGRCRRWRLNLKIVAIFIVSIARKVLTKKKDNAKSVELQLKSGLLCMDDVSINKKN